MPVKWSLPKVNLLELQQRQWSNLKKKKEGKFKEKKKFKKKGFFMLERKKSFFYVGKKKNYEKGFFFPNSKYLTIAVNKKPTGSSISVHPNVLFGSLNKGTIHLMNKVI